MIVRKRPPPFETARRGWHVALLAVVYFAVARLGLLMPVPPGFATLVWPASGVALAWMLPSGTWVWPGIWLGAFAANLYSFIDTQGQVSLNGLATAAAIAVGNTLEAVVATGIVRRWQPHPPVPRHPDQVLGLTVAAVVSCLVAATNGVFWLHLGGWLTIQQVAFVWQSWCLGDLVGIIVVAPPLLAWRLKPDLNDAPASSSEKTLFVVVTTLVAAITMLQVPRHSPPTLYPLILCQVWCAVRLGLTWTTAVNLVLAAVMLILTGLGVGVFAAYSSSAALMFLQGFVGVCAVMALVLATLAATQRATAEDLRQSAYRLQAVLDNVGAVIYLKDAAGRYVMVNRRFTEFFGRAQEDVIGATDHDLMPAAAADILSDEDRQVATSNQRLMFEETVPGASGPRSFLTVKFPLRSANGELGGICGVSTDITDRLQSEAQLRQIDALKHADTLKNQFLNVLSHELRTPLTVINGYTGILDHGIAGPMNDQQHGYLHRIQEACDNMTRLVTDLLDVSRIIAGRFTMQPRPMDPVTCVDHVAADLRVLAGKKGVTLANTVPMDLPRVMADPQRLEQVLTNLIGNAIKFTPPGGSIDLKAQVRSDHLLLSVTDTGEGIPLAQQPLLFHRFSQVDMSRERRVSGLGLGLSICREIIQAHGGTIGVDSSPGKGSTFWFTLPLAESLPAPDDQAA